MFAKMRKLLVSFIFLVFFFPSYAQTDTVRLNSNWEFRSIGADEWMKAQVPGTVHTDLLNAQSIFNPFFGKQEASLQWIEKKDWEYRCLFTPDARLLERKNLELVFEGLDTHAEIYLNEQLLGRTNNMFRRFSFNIKPYLLSGSNRIRILFRSPAKYDDSLARVSLPLVLPGENSRMYSRKAQYHYGWDWAPRLLTSGIWKPVFLFAWDEVNAGSLTLTAQKLSDKRGEINAVLRCRSLSAGQLLLRPQLQLPGGEWINIAPIHVLVQKGENRLSFKIPVNNPATWWCNGMGKAELYQVKLQYGFAGKSMDEISNTVGFRTIELVQEKEKEGSSFYFKLNGKSVYIRGANFVPADVFLPRALKLKQYQRLIGAVREANMNMLRVWGGGVYEDDEFYRLCDENGIMVWQDFMFAGAMYPWSDTFLNNVREEVDQQVLRLGSHPCLTLWCGNNEMEEAWFNWGWQQQFKLNKNDSARIYKGYRNLFHELIPARLKHLNSAVPYRPSSPSTGWGRPEAYRQGDVHYWGVWWGKEPVESYNDKVGRFNSEYGMQSLPALQTIREFALESDWDTTSVSMKAHQKHPFGYQNIKMYIEDKFKPPQQFEHLVYISQLMQADAMATAIAAHRSNKPYNMGTLYWQLNDCWPGVTWSSIDYFGRKKALHYRLKDLFKNEMLTVSSMPESFAVQALSEKPDSLKVWIRLEVRTFDGRVIQRQKLDVELSREEATHVMLGKSVQPIDEANSYIHVRMTPAHNDETLAETIAFFLPPKDLQLPKAAISLKQVGQDSIELSSPVFAYGVYLDLHSYVETDDNYFHLRPGEKRRVRVSGPYPLSQLFNQIKIYSLADTY